MSAHQRQKLDSRADKFVMLRGSNNLPLVCAIRFAVEERLGGTSSRAMEITDARIAFLQFMFDVRHESERALHHPGPSVQSGPDEDDAER